MGHILPVVLVCTALLIKSSWAKEAKVTDTCNPTWNPLYGSMIHVSASVNYFWAVNRENKIFVCNVPCTGNWKLVDGGLSELDLDDTEVWGVNSNDLIWKRPVNGGGSWTRVSGALRHVSASGSGYIWGVNAGENIYKCKKPCNGEWEQVEGKLVQIDGGSKYVYGVSRDQKIWFRPVDGSGKWQTPTNGRAICITGPGCDKVYVVGTDNKVYQCNAPCADDKFTPISDDTLTQIDGSVFMLVGRNSAEQVYYKYI